MKIFLPMIDNGMNLCRRSYAQCLLPGFGPRLKLGDIVIEAPFSYPYPDGAMNIVTALFMNSDCDVMFNIDLDMDDWGADEVNRMLELSEQHPLVFAPYSKKRPGLELALTGLIPGSLPETGPDGLWRAAASARGFMCIRREVFEVMQPHCEKYFEPQLNSEQFLYWQNMSGGHSEDFQFCERWRNLGGEIIVDPSLMPGHVGDFSFGKRQPFPLR